MDAGLVIRAQRGDKEAYALIATEIADRFLAVARRILRDIDLAEDATQQALIAIWQDLPQLRDPARFEAWSYRLLVNACYTEGRRQRRWAPNLRLFPAVEPVAADDLSSVVDRDQLDSGFRRLSIDHRAVVVLHHYLELPLDTARIVRSWLRTDEHESADRILAMVLVAVDTIPQRRSMWPARRIAMNAYAKLAVAAAAVLAIAVVGFNLLPAGNSPGVGGPAPTPSLPPTPTPTASVERGTSLLGYDFPTGPLETGRHESGFHQIPFSFAVPSGWRGNLQYVGMLEKGVAPAASYGWVGLGLDPFVPDVATDPCAGLTRPVGPSVDDLATALATIPGTTAEEPVDTTVGGLPAKLIVLTLQDDIGCSPSQFYFWGPGGAHPTSLDSTIRIWIFELNGQLRLIHTDQAGANEELAREIPAIVNSIQFE